MPNNGPGVENGVDKELNPLPLAESSSPISLPAIPLSVPCFGRQCRSLNPVRSASFSSSSDSGSFSSDIFNSRQIPVGFQYITKVKREKNKAKSRQLKNIAYGLMNARKSVIWSMMTSDCGNAGKRTICKASRHNEKCKRISRPPEAEQADTKEGTTEKGGNSQVGGGRGRPVEYARVPGDWNVHRT